MKRVTTVERRECRKVDPSSEGQSEATSPSVPAADRQGEEDLWQGHKAERGVWSEKMLMALETGVKGNVWFSLIDKLYARVHASKDTTSYNY